MLFKAELAQNHGPCLRTMELTQTLKQLRDTLAVEYQQELDPMISEITCNSDENTAKRVEEKVKKMLDGVETNIIGIRNRLESQKSQTAL